jgi:enoyl-CoA hydratase/carnithine racemase
MPKIGDATEIAVSRIEAVAIVHFSNQPSGVLTGKGAELLLLTVTTLIADEAVRSIVITGAQPEVFIRHYDLNSILKAGEALKSGRARPEDFAAAPFAALTDLIASCSKPVIAAINGTCMGGGLELALACDIRIASRTTSDIGLPEVLLDIFPGGGGTQRLARAIGEGAALDMILRGRTVDAARAHALGLVHEIVDDALAHSISIAHAMTRYEPAALTAAKRLVRRALHCSLDEGLADERMEFAVLLRDYARPTATLRRVLEAGIPLEELSRSATKNTRPPQL